MRLERDLSCKIYIDTSTKRKREKERRIASLCGLRLNIFSVQMESIVLICRIAATPQLKPWVYG